MLLHLEKQSSPAIEPILSVFRTHARKTGVVHACQISPLLRQCLGAKKLVSSFLFLYVANYTRGSDD